MYLDILTTFYKNLMIILSVDYYNAYRSGSFLGNFGNVLNHDAITQ
jgi:hypothetical protein